jgi:hypothetical protein
VAALGWKHILRVTGVEVQVHQKAAPDAKGEKGAQAWRDRFLLGGEKGGNLRPAAGRAASPPWAPWGSSLRLGHPSPPSWCHVLFDWVVVLGGSVH